MCSESQSEGESEGERARDSLGNKGKGRETRGEKGEDKRQWERRYNKEWGCRLTIL